MISNVGIGQGFWEEEVETTCYLINQSPTSTLVEKTPQQVWTSKKPSIKHLKCFGCDAQLHAPKEKRRKLDNKDENFIFNAYKDSMKGYNLWNPVTKIEFIRCCVQRGQISPQT